MPYDPDKHHRRSIRLRGYDYSAASAYFITLCTEGRNPRFGAVDNGAMRPSAAGAEIDAIWQALPERFPSVVLDAWVVMPDHVHGMLWLTEPQRVTLGAVVGAYKSLTTNAYIAGVRTRAWPPFEGRLWQRNYYEHIIRHDAALARIRAYIEQNPAR